MPHNILAKDAIALRQMNMIMVLAPCGTLMLYSGPSLVGKVHVAGILSSFVTSSAISNTFGSSFPRRSSLLPTVTNQSESNFDEELHMLSPVPPLQSSSPQPARLNNCQQIRDATGNRVTLVFGDKSFRISLPLVTESLLVSKCLLTLREILPKDLAMATLIKWYGTRNTPGTQDYSREKEWEIFKNMIFQLCGRPYPPAESNLHKSLSKSSFDEPKKRRKSDHCMGSDSDWEYLIKFLNGEKDKVPKVQSSYSSEGLLFNHIPNILYSLHLVYEDLKLDPTMKEDLRSLALMTYELSLDLKLDKYQAHYFIDFPDLVQIRSFCYVENSDAGKFVQSNLMANEVPHIFKYIANIISRASDKDHQPYPYVPNLNDTSRDIVLLVAYIYKTKSLTEWVKKQAAEIIGSIKLSSNNPTLEELQKAMANVVVKIMLKRNLNRPRIEQMPVAIHYLLSQFLETCRNNPTNCYDPDVYELLLRPELYAHATYTPQDTQQRVRLSNNVSIKNHSLTLRRRTQPEVLPKQEVKVEENGMEYIDTKLLRLRFPDDLRINDVKAFLNSSQPVTIDIVQAPNVSDHEFIEEQEKQLYALCTRTMALPIGEYKYI